MQLKATLVVLATMALTVLANPVPGTTAIEKPVDGLLERGVCYCLCDPCTGGCKLCESGGK
ncbi:hypothetical protein DPSP01_000939 [Paraphaeosphaeria sporulosa]